MPQTARLILNQPEQSHFGEYYRIYSDPRTNLFNPAGPMTSERAAISFQNLLQHWKEHHFGIWVISPKDEHQVIGFGGLSYLNYGGIMRLNLGYRFDADNWGRGYATELSEFGIGYGFEELNAERIFALVRPAHAASIRVLEKCSMRLLDQLDDVPGKEPSLVYSIDRPGDVG